MKVILTSEVSGLGSAGDTIEVKRGYARNFLFRRGLATEWTNGGEKQVASITAAREARAVATLEEAQSIKGNLENGNVTVRARAGKDGRLYGAVTTSEIADAVAEKGQTVDRRKVEIGSPIRNIGDYEVQVHLHPEVTATVKVKVAAAAAK